MSSAYYGKTDKPHSQYLGIENFCPGCGKDITILLLDKKHPSLPQSTSSVKSIITLLSNNEDDIAVPVLTTARFPTFQVTASTVETACQTVISKTQNATGWGQSLNAGAKTLASQHKLPKSVLVMENVKISIVKGINGSKLSFSILGMVFIS